MKADYHPMFNPVPADGYENMPAELQAMCVPAEQP